MIYLGIRFEYYDPSIPAILLYKETVSKYLKLPSCDWKVVPDQSCSGSLSAASTVSNDQEGLWGLLKSFLKFDIEDVQANCICDFWLTTCKRKSCRFYGTFKMVINMQQKCLEQVFSADVCCKINHQFEPITIGKSIVQDYILIRIAERLYWRAVLA